MYCVTKTVHFHNPTMVTLTFNVNYLAHLRSLTAVTVKYCSVLQNYTLHISKTVENCWWNKEFRPKHKFKFLLYQKFTVVYGNKEFQPNMLSFSFSLFVLHKFMIYCTIHYMYWYWRVWKSVSFLAAIIVPSSGLHHMFARPQLLFSVMSYSPGS